MKELRREYARAARWTAIIAAGTCALVVALLIHQLAMERRMTPLNSPEMAMLKAQLQERPNDEELKAMLRQRDLELRTAFFAITERSARGTWLLVAAAAALALALKSYGALTREPHVPGQQRVDTHTEQRLARVGVGVSAAMLLGVG